MDHAMITDDHPGTSTLIVFYSISGSAGKSYLASLLFEQWTDKRAKGDGNVPPSLLVDADLVGATASRAAEGGLIFGVAPASIEYTCTTLDLIAERVNVPAHTRFVPAASWLRCATESRRAPAMPINDIDGFEAASRSLKAREELPESLSHAQRVQSRLARDPAAHKQLWRNLVDAAVRHGPRRVLVDLPAQGPSGVSLDDNWRRIRTEATEVLESLRGQRGKAAGDLRLVRMLVFGSEEPRLDSDAPLLPQHPLIRRTEEGVRKEAPGLQDVVVVENFWSRKVEKGAQSVHPRLVRVPLCDRKFTTSPTAALVDMIKSGKGTSGIRPNIKRAVLGPGSGLVAEKDVARSLEDAIKTVPLLLRGAR